MKEGPGHLAGLRSTDLGVMQLMINERCDYITVIQVKTVLLTSIDLFFVHVMAISFLPDA